MTKTTMMAALLGFIFPVFASANSQGKEITRTVIPNQHIISFVTTAKISNVSALAQSLSVSFLEMTEGERVGAIKVLFTQPIRVDSSKINSAIVHKTLVLFDKSRLDGQTWKKLISSSVAVYPNYQYSGDLYDDLDNPDDPQFEDQYHHPVMQNTLAWELLNNSKTVVVAVTDDGVDLDHEDLKDNIFVNDKEIAGNNIDDDGNGYIDDVMGWDFADDDNDSNPSDGSHGTHVSGIIGATANNGVGVAGTAAPIVKIMPLRFYSGFGFTSAVVAETYKYAADNGADIITTSYNIDYFVGDKVFEDAIAYAYDKGVLHFNSAGNAQSNGPERRAFQELVLVCSTNREDKKNAFSNYGPGVDICAPGGSILSTVPDNKYERKSGTSMAAPNAAAVAALIWAHNPEWTRDQVVAQLFSTADNIDEQNIGFIGTLGAGRVNSYMALSAETTKAPQYSSIDEISRDKANKGITSFSVRFSHLLDPATVIPKAFSLYRKSRKVMMTIDRPYKAGSNEVKLNFNELEAGDYTLYVKPSLKDPFGNALDGNADGIPGDERVIQFTVEN